MAMINSTRDGGGERHSGFCWRMILRAPQATRYDLRKYVHQVEYYANKQLWPLATEVVTL